MANKGTDGPSNILAFMQQAAVIDFINDIEIKKITRQTFLQDDAVNNSCEKPQMSLLLALVMHLHRFLLLFALPWSWLNSQFIRQTGRRGF